MEEKELTQRLYDMFDATIPILEKIEKGFLTQNQAMLLEGEGEFVKILTSNLSFAEKIMSQGQKSEADKRFLGQLTHLQGIALALRGLIAKDKTILRRNVTLSVKAIGEVMELTAVVKAQVRDTRDFVLTRNPLLKESIRSGSEKIIRMVDEYGEQHQERLLSGTCMPAASYLYLDIIGSIKRIAKELVGFSERV